MISTTTATSTTSNPDQFNDTIIVFNEYYSSNSPVLLDIGSDFSLELEGFQFGRETGNYGSCSFVQNGIMYIVGGNGGEFDQQISTVESCRLRKIGDLPNRFDVGACNNYRNPAEEEQALLCFTYADPNGCLRYLRFFIISVHDSGTAWPHEIISPRKEHLKMIQDVFGI